MVHNATILGHMTGRQHYADPVYEVDIEEILAACAAHGVAVEINANPWRLDLDWRWHDRALERGCMMSMLSATCRNSRRPIVIPRRARSGIELARCKTSACRQSANA
jgi:hypothetical protein